MKVQGVVGVWVMLASCASTGPSEIRAMGARGDTAALIDAYHEVSREDLRMQILGALRSRPDPEATQLFVDVGRRGSASERVVALGALGDREDARSAPVLIDALGDPMAAVRAAARTSVSRQVGALSEELRRAARGHPNSFVRAAALSALVQAAERPSDRSELGPVLVGALSDAAPEVRREAVVGLGRIGWAPARSAVVERMRADPSRTVRMAAQTALERLGGSNAPRPVVAVLPLDVGAPDPSGELGRLAAQVAEVARARLTETPLCDVIDRRRMDTVLAELRKTGKLVYDGDGPSAPAIGEFKIANQLVYGRVSKQGPVYSVILQRLDVATLRLVGGGSVAVDGYAGELDRLIAEVVDRFVSRFR